MSIEGTGLSVNCLDDSRIAVPYMRHIVIAVKILATISVPQPDTLAPDNMHRVIIKGSHIRAEQARAPCYKFTTQWNHPIRLLTGILPQRHMAIIYPAVAIVA